LVSKNDGAATMGRTVELAWVIGGAAFLASLKIGAVTAELGVAGFVWVMGALGNAGAPDVVGVASVAGTSEIADIPGACEKPGTCTICGAVGASEAEKARFK
jgi:hypothetical protein